MDNLFIVFTLAIALAAATTFVFRVVKPGANRRPILPSAVCLSAVVLLIAAAGVLRQGENTIFQILVKIWQFDRLTLLLVASASSIGVLCSLSMLQEASSPRHGIWRVLLFLLGIFGLTILSFKSEVGTMLATYQNVTRVTDQNNRFRIMEVADLPFAPTSIEVGPDNNLYIAGFSGIALQNGIVAEVDLAAEPTASVQTVASYLNRPHGLAYHDGALYVSRAGQFSRAVGGRIVQQNTGCVTKLRDLDGDGVFDDYTDIVKDLPGAQQPDGLHQNNGIVFDRVGKLYITVGSPSDHGPSQHPYSGTILRSNADGSDVTVFARGFRNPYGIAIDSSGRLFVTDNDSDAANTGDEINFVKEGSHYGHPYNSVSTGVQIDGAIPPFLTCKSAQGIASGSSNLSSPHSDDCLYVASFGEDSIQRVVYSNNDAALSGKLEFVAHVPGVVDVAIGEDGSLYAISYTKRKVYRVTLD